MRHMTEGWWTGAGAGGSNQNDLRARVAQRREEIRKRRLEMGLLEVAL